jgi:hypothetical protein
MARKPHTYHYIYKTICNVTGKYYIGMHSCSNLEDGYMGSGVKIRRSLNKHGIENHTKEIIEFLDDRESLKKREKEIVNENMIQDPLCMNLQLGGGGGFSSEEHRKRFNEASNKSRQSDEFRKKISNSICELWKNDEYRKTHTDALILSKRFLGKTHTEETKEKMRNVDRTGNKNSQSGTCWITNGIENKKIKREDQIPNGWKLGRKI